MGSIHAPSIPRLAHEYYSYLDSRTNDAISRIKDSLATQQTYTRYTITSTLEDYIMYHTIDKRSFRNAFRAMDRENQFSHDGLGVLYDHLLDMEDETGKPIELDVIGFCCEFVEGSVAKIADDFDINISTAEDDDDRRTIVLEFLCDQTHVVGDTDASIVYQQF